MKKVKDDPFHVLFLFIFMCYGLLNFISTCNGVMDSEFYVYMCHRKYTKLDCLVPGHVLGCWLNARED